MMNGVFLVLFLSLIKTEAGVSKHSSSAPTYIVHMDTTKVSAIEASLDGTRKWHEVILDSVRRAGDDEAPELLYVYNIVLTGFAAKLTIRQLAFIKELDGFISAYPDKLLHLHTTHTPKFLGLNPGTGLWSSENLANDVIIGFIDTGIWPEHISFHDSGLGPIPARWKGRCEATPSRFSCNRKIIGARVFWKGHLGMVEFKEDLSPAEFLSARDAHGHGTHTASIAAGSRVLGANLFGYANGTASGVHSAARIAAYKVCWRYGCAESDSLAALDQAVADGVDVVSISLGPEIHASSAFHQSVFAVAAYGAIQKGVFVSCSGGNSGPMESSIKNDAPWIMTVAASSVDRSFPALVKLSDGRTFRGESLYRGLQTGELPIAYDPKCEIWNATCYCLRDTLPTGFAEGKLVLCDMGNGNTAAKGEEVKRAGGAAMLLLNRESEGEDLVAETHVLPAATLGAAAATAIRAYKRSTPHATASITFLGTIYGAPAPVMTAFSSRGPSLAGPGVIKPDVTAPGMNILAAWTPNVSPSSDKRRVFFNVLSGTSMSCPHVSGLAALIKSLHQDWSPAAIKSALMTTAYTLDNFENSIVDISTQKPATPFVLGSGHIDPERAAHPGLVYDIEPDDYLRFMCAMNYTSSQVSVVARRKYSCAESDRVYTAGWNLNYPSFSVLLHGGIHNETVVQRRTVTNVGPCGCTYMAIAMEPVGVHMTVQPPVLKFSKTGEKLAYKVTFVGSDPKKTNGYSFGELVWFCRKLTVRSPVAVAWGLHAWTD